jgi:hypothetical protein
MSDVLCMNEGLWNLTGLNGRPENLDIAVGCFQRSSCNVDSQYFLQKLQACRTNSVKDVFQAEESDSRGLFVAGMLMKDDERIRKSANMGNGYAEAFFGTSLYFGGFVKEAANYYTRSALQGNPLGMYELGRCFYLGFGVGKNLSQAFVWTQKAAEMMWGRAVEMCAFMYLNGSGIATDLERSIYYGQQTIQISELTQNKGVFALVLERVMNPFLNGYRKDMRLVYMLGEYLHEVFAQNACSSEKFSPLVKIWANTALDVYSTQRIRARKAAVCAILCLKHIVGLNVAQCIGKEIWKSKTSPIWYLEGEAQD